MAPLAVLAAVVQLIFENYMFVNTIDTVFE